MSAHLCHALGCEVAVPPQRNMCPQHWRMVPRVLQRRLWAAYRAGQERRKDPSAAYLTAAGACVAAVARAEGHAEEAIAREVGRYEVWARRVAGRPS